MFTLKDFSDMTVSVGNMALIYLITFMELKLQSGFT